jgi:glycosyltransferase involved in cell wall biosynthesis
VTGIERYAQGVALHLPAALADWTITVIAAEDSPLRVGDGARIVRVPRTDRIRQDQVALPRALRRIEPDVTFFPGFTPPLSLSSAGRVLAQIHDAAIWRYPETLSRGARFYYKPSLAFSLRRRAIHAVITSSRAAASDLTAYVPADIPVFGIPPGVARHGVNQNGESGPPAHTSIDGDFVLAVGTVEPRKNYPTLMEAWKLLADQGLSIPLKIVGRLGWGQTLAPDPSIAHLVELLGSVPDAELAELYAGCRAFVMPSFYEGFGVPVVEAMLRGSQCLVADIPVFREIGGPLLRYIQPDSPASWASAIATAWHVTPRPSQELVERGEWFSWERCANAIADVIHGLV